MKPTERQLNDPQWWDSNVDSGLDFCYTTGKDWDGDKEKRGTFVFSKSGGWLNDDTRLCVSDDGWILHCERPEHQGNNEKHDAASKFIPEAGQWCEVLESGKWTRCKILAFNRCDLDRLQIVVKDHTHNAAILYEEDGIEFRPIKSERDVFIELVAEAICNASIEQLDVKGSTKRIAGILHDAGFKPPEVK